MKRELLEGLELDKETIDTIMAEYGKTTQGLREKKKRLLVKKELMLFLMMLNC